MNTEDDLLGELPNLAKRVWVGPPEYVDGRVMHYAKRLGSSVYLKMGAREAFLLTRLDGQSTFDEVAAGYRQKFGKHLTQGSMLSALKLFESRGLMRDSAQITSSSAASASGIASHQGLLNQKLYFWNPDPDFSRIAHLFGWFISWPALLVWSAIIICAEWATYRNLGAIWIGIDRSSGYTLGIRAITLVMIYFFATMLHEAGHGVACKRHGGEVKEMGIMLRYFMLAAYTRIDDILLFEKRGHRIQVLLVGPLISLTVIPFALLTWLRTEPGSALHLVSIDLLIWYNAACLIQFLPFLQFDGYFILAQLIRMPELRKDAAAHVFRRIVALSTGRPVPPVSADCAGYVAPVMTIYGIASFFVTFGVLTWLALKYSSAVTSGLGKTMGFTLTVCVLGYVAARLYLQFLPWAKRQYKRVLAG
jgi:putative peptide zinc metalloprotease protein